MTKKGKLKKLSGSADEEAQCVSFNLRRASRAVSQKFDQIMRPSGLRTTQFALLYLLSRAGPMPMTELAERMVMDRTTLTRNLRPLTRRGHLRVVQGEDRRTRLVSLTDEGRRALENALPLWQAAQDRILSGLGDRHWHRLLTELRRVVSVSEKA